MTFKNIGVFGEVEQDLNDRNRIIGGLRTDFLDVDNENPASLESDNNTTYGAFLRYEHDYASAPVTSYIGIGHAERPADWWERYQVFFLDPEKTRSSIRVLFIIRETSGLHSPCFTQRSTNL
jgi:iron complex outermembrane receptor protein